MSVVVAVTSIHTVAVVAAGKVFFVRVCESDGRRGCAFEYIYIYIWFFAGFTHTY